MSGATELRGRMHPGLRPSALVGLLALSACQSLPSAHSPKVARGALLQARLPYYAEAEGTPLDEVSLLERLFSHDAVCIGEAHDDAADHYVQWQLALRLGHLAAQRGYEFAVGLEMLDYERQPALDAFRRGDLDEAAFLEQSDWDAAWGYSFEFYRPTLASSGRLGADWLALNAPRAWARSVAQQGPTALSETALGSGYTLDLTDEEHRAFFAQAIGMPLPKARPAPQPQGPNEPAPATAPGEATGAHGGLAAENLYAAQVLWDTFMAERAGQWLDGAPKRKLLILAGDGHCLRSGVPRRLSKLGHSTLSATALRHSMQPHAGGQARSDFDLLLVVDDRAAAP